MRQVKLAKMKNKKVVILSVILAIIFISGIGLVVFYNVNLGSVSKISEVTDDDKVLFAVKSGDASKTIIDNLADAGLIRNRYVTYIYVKTHSLSMQAGTYELNKGMTLEEIFKKLSNGDIADNTISITFIEGKRFVNYVKVISDNFGYSEEEIINELEDENYLRELIDKYSKQLEFYTRALEEATGKKVYKRYIYSTYLGKGILL